ncbi:MAG: type IX secretion system protein PorQ [Bacteroidetes bacterium]|nr:type IX secretion system protein PorQ [Bacteroidota bacterium]
MKQLSTILRHKVLLISVIMTLSSLGLLAQIGGRGTYDFLNAALPARAAALGGTALPIDDGDIQLSLFNPALINAEMHNQLSLSYVDYFSDIRFSSIQYGRSIANLGNFVGSLQYHNYGKFEYADEAGQRDGTFGASDYAFMLGWGRQLDSNFSIGAQVKFVGSQYETYSSFGLAVDVAGTYKTSEGWLFSLTARNIGSEMKSYLPGDASTMPFNMQFGVSKRLDHVPFRIILIYDNLQQWDLTYDDPLDLKGKIDPITGTKTESKGAEKLADQFMRHIVLGGEFYIGKNLILRGSYNYKRRQEMQIPDRLAMIGFSWGVGIRVSKFNINYSRSTFHVVGSPNYLTISTNLSNFSR